ncbi:MAG: hypothetical protein ABIO44_09310, partial [Saprospiraceae bacterium]
KTLEFKSENLDLERVIDGKLFLTVNSNFPISANVAMEFLDDNNQATLILYKIDGLIEAGDLGNADRVLNKKTSIITVPISNLQIQDLKKAKKVRIKAIFNTKPEMTSIKLFDSYSMEIVLSADFNYKLE